MSDTFSKYDDEEYNKIIERWRRGEFPKQVREQLLYSREVELIRIGKIKNAMVIMDTIIYNHPR